MPTIFYRSILSLGAIFLIGCSQAHSSKYAQVDGEYIATGVWKFEDGDLVCYTYYHESITCVKVK